MCIKNAEEYIPIHTKFKRLNEIKNKIKCITETQKLRSQSQLFNFRTHCFICGQAVKGKEIEVYLVRTNDLPTTNLKVCQERNDDWAVAARGRIETINNLHAADAIFHQTCSVNFRTIRLYLKDFFRTQKKMKTEVDPKMASKRTILKSSSTIYINITMNR